MKKDTNVQPSHVSQHSSNEMLAAVLPCPFCGRDGKIIHKHYQKNYMGMRTQGSGFMNMDARTIWFVTCSNSSCPMKPTTPYQPEKTEAIKVWNCRSNGS
jgi:hypothetical protein